MFNTRAPALFALPVTILLLTGCGQTGPLQLPPQGSPAPVAAAAAEPVSPAEQPATQPFTPSSAND